MIWLIPIAILALGSFIIRRIYPEASVSGLLAGFIVALLSLIPLAVILCLLLLMSGREELLYPGGALGILFSIWVWIAIARRSSRKRRDNSTNS